MRFRLLLGFLLVLVLALLGCEAEPTATPTPAPTATLAPTDTPVPTDTPTATPTKVQLPPAVGFALTKTQNLRSLVFEFESGISILKDGKTTQIPGLTLKGQDSTLNRHVTLSGSGDNSSFISYEVIILGDAVYIKGLTGLDGVNPQTWYSLPPQAQESVRNLPTARGLLASFDEAEFTRAQFEPAGNETLDEQSCSIWAASNQDAAEAMLGVSQGSDLRAQLGTIDSAAFKLWTCGDGFIHLMTGEVVGHDADNKANTSTVSVRFHMNHFDEALDISAPLGAVPFQPPTARPPTVTPSPSPTGPTSTPAPTTPTAAATAKATVAATATVEAPTSEPTSSGDTPTAEATTEATAGATANP